MWSGVSVVGRRRTLFLLVFTAGSDSGFDGGSSKPQGKSLIGWRANGLGEHDERVLVAGCSHLEDVHRSVDRSIEDRHETDTSRLREVLDQLSRTFIRELGDEHGEERILYRHDGPF